MSGIIVSQPVSLNVKPGYEYVYARSYQHQTEKRMFYLYFFKMRRSRFFEEFVLKTFLDGLNKQNINGLIFWEIQNLITISEFCCHAKSFKYHCDYNLISLIIDFGIVFEGNSNSISSLMVSLKLGYFSHKQNSSRSTFTPVSHTFDKKNAD